MWRKEIFWTSLFWEEILFKRRRKWEEKIIEEIIGKAISIQIEEDLWNENIESFTNIRLRTKDWEKFNKK